LSFAPRRPVVGWMNDLDAMTRRTRDFYQLVLPGNAGSGGD
jgi:hypothetical protein